LGTGKREVGRSRQKGVKGRRKRKKGFVFLFCLVVARRPRAQTGRRGSLNNLGREEGKDRPAGQTDNGYTVDREKDDTLWNKIKTYRMHVTFIRKAKRRREGEI